MWGAAFGLEVALWFQRPGEVAEEDVTFRRSNAFDVVAEEVAAVRNGVGLFETTGYAKYEITGPAPGRGSTDCLPTTSRRRAGLR